MVALDGECPNHEKSAERHESDASSQQPTPEHHGKEQTENQNEHQYQPATEDGPSSHKKQIPSGHHVVAQSLPSNDDEAATGDSNEHCERPHQPSPQ